MCPTLTASDTGSKSANSEGAVSTVWGKEEEANISTEGTVLVKEEQTSDGSEGVVPTVLMKEEQVQEEQVNDSAEGTVLVRTRKMPITTLKVLFQLFW